jgi:hypothetical protein
VIETTTGLKLENSRFDKYWFDERKSKLKSLDSLVNRVIMQHTQLDRVCKGYSHKIYSTLINNHLELQKTKNAL